MTTDTSVTWLTQEAFDRLTTELDTLSSTGREEITKKIESAREEGDLKENSGYHAAKDEQGKMEARIRTLTQLLRTAEVGDAPESHGVVQPGTVITATIAGDESRFLIGSREIAGNSDLDVYSDADVELDLAELQADAVPRVQHLDDIGVRLGEKLCDAGELARTVGKHDA